MKRTKSNRREKGTQIAELAIVLPLLAMLALIVSEGAGLVRAHAVINNAAREGARLSIDPANQGQTSQIISAVQSYITTESNGKLNGVNATITINQAVPISFNNGTTTLTDTASLVTVTYPYTVQFLPSVIGGPKTYGLQVSAEFQNLY
jgi:Flp pilus assembly protein TadG